jgi:hypothetical protein
LLATNAAHARVVFRKFKFNINIVHSFDGSTLWLACGVSAGSSVWFQGQSNDSQLSFSKEEFE